MPKWRRFKGRDKRKEAEKKSDFSHFDTLSPADLKQECLLTQTELQFAERQKHKNRTAVAKRKLAYLIELLKKKQLQLNLFIFPVYFETMQGPCAM